MTREQHGDEDDEQSFSLRADYHRYDGVRRTGSDSAGSITIDKTAAMVLGAIGSAAIAVAIAGGTALVQKVDDTAREVEKGRSERIAAFGEVSKNISVVETKVNQLIDQNSPARNAHRAVDDPRPGDQRQEDRNDRQRDRQTGRNNERRRTRQSPSRPVNTRKGTSRSPLGTSMIILVPPAERTIGHTTKPPSRAVTRSRCGATGKVPKHARPAALRRA